MGEWEFRVCSLGRILGALVIFSRVRVGIASKMIGLLVNRYRAMGLD